jgi:hypothetical protein
MGTYIFQRSGRLFVRPSFVEGMARLFDTANSLNVYNADENGKEADLKALAADWSAVGDDLRAAINQYGRGRAE